MTGDRDPLAVKGAVLSRVGSRSAFMDVYLVLLSSTEEDACGNRGVRARSWLSRGDRIVWSYQNMVPAWTTITAIRTKKVGLSKNSLYWRLDILEGTSF